jgi:hypothetical protein
MDSYLMILLKGVKTKRCGLVGGSRTLGTYTLEGYTIFPVQDPMR